MAVSIPRTFIAAGLLCVAAATAAQDRAQLPITVEARSSDFDYRNGVLVFSQVTIVQGGIRIEAASAQATGLDFEDSRWEFSGSVRIGIPDGSLQSDHAQVRFAGGEIATAVVNGAPATFEQRRGEQFAQGRAERIDYDHERGTVLLAGGAWLSDGRNQITGTRLTYSTMNQRVMAQSAEQGGEPVRITISPREPPTAPPRP